MFWRLTTTISTLLKLINFTWFFTLNWNCWSIFFMNITKIWTSDCLVNKPKNSASTLWIKKNFFFKFGRRRDKIYIFFENVNTFKSTIVNLKIVMLFDDSILINEIIWKKIRLLFFMFNNKSHWFIHDLFKMISWSSRFAMNIKTMNYLYFFIRMLK